MAPNGLVADCPEPSAAEEGIVAPTAITHIVTGPAVKDVPSLTAVEDVVAEPPMSTSPPPSP